MLKITFYTILDDRVNLVSPKKIAPNCESKSFSSAPEDTIISLKSAQEAVLEVFSDTQAQKNDVYNVCFFHIIIIIIELNRD